MGGLDQIRSYAVPAGTSAAVIARIPVQPKDFALRRARSSERSLTSTAWTVASGERSASVSAIGPQPQPRSRKVPVAGGGGASASSTAVPLSSPSGEKVPGAVSTSTVRSARRMRIDRRSGSVAGALDVK